MTKVSQTLARSQTLINQQEGKLPPSSPSLQVQGICITPLLYDEQLRCASFDLRLSPEIPKTTHRLDLQALFEHYPNLRRHRCDSGCHRSFFDEARQTETAHLLEHIAVELLALSGVPRDTARGQTGIPQVESTEKNTKEKETVYRLRFYGADSLEQMDDLLRQAVGILEKLIVKQL